MILVFMGMLIPGINLLMPLFVTFEDINHQIPKRSTGIEHVTDTIPQPDEKETSALKNHLQKVMMLYYTPACKFQLCLVIV